ncbi:MAG: hypothetical protein CVU16_05175 [Betaproteobacteria bacterium HGW-Betaproteobacteria-10]|jgi:hypothetical protein|nr:MAG: hypothetical protein CVU16_05175 [Betaproteobacteria bacterium HGW-Betaproteobacteria-10]
MRSADDKTPLSLEWQILHNNHEQHEQSALLIKLSSLALLVVGLAAHLPALWLGLAVSLCWLLEGIYKTYQGRLLERLLIVETLLRQADAAHGSALQLYSEWAKQRPRALSLIADYARSALRPTVTIPYLPILVLLGLAKFLHWA